MTPTGKGVAPGCIRRHRWLIASGVILPAGLALIELVPDRMARLH